MVGVAEDISESVTVCIASVNQVQAKNQGHSTTDATLYSSGRLKPLSMVRVPVHGTPQC